MSVTSGDELVEEVDASGAVVRVVTRREMRRERLRHRSVFVLVRSSDAKVLVHRRHPDKDVWPGWWDIAVGGVVGVGEPWDLAARREVHEEVGVDTRPLPIDGGRSVTYDDDQVSLVARCYEATHDGPFRFVDGEVTEACFLSVDELRQFVHQVPVLPDSLTLLSHHLGL